MVEGIDTETPEPAAGMVEDWDEQGPQRCECRRCRWLRCELAKVLCDFRDGAGDGVEEAIERILEVTGRADPEVAAGLG